MFSSPSVHLILLSVVFLTTLPPSFAYTGLFHTFTVAPSSSSSSSFNGTIVSDGFLQFCQSPYKADEALVRDVLLHHRGSPSYHTIAMNVAIVDIAESRLMVDVGVYLPPELQHQPNGGKLLTSMEQAGIHPASIDAIVLTHCHLDHSAGLVAPDGSAAFPNARVYVAHAEHLFWSNPRNDTERQDLDNLEITKRQYLKALSLYPGKVCFLQDLEDVVDGVNIRLAPGHSPGHSIVEFQHDSARLTVTGDLWHLRELQLTYPETGTIFDTSSKQAHLSREKMINLFAERGDLLVSYHDHFPGLGYIRRKKDGVIDWVSANINDLQPGTINRCAGR